LRPKDRRPAAACPLSAIGRKRSRQSSAIRSSSRIAGAMCTRRRGARRRRSSIRASGNA